MPSFLLHFHPSHVNLVWLLCTLCHIATEVCYSSHCRPTWKEKSVNHNLSVLLQTQKHVFSVKSAGLHVFALAGFIICSVFPKSVAWEGCPQNRTEVTCISIQNCMLQSTDMHNISLVPLVGRCSDTLVNNEAWLPTRWKMKQGAKRKDTNAKVAADSD